MLSYHRMRPPHPVQADGGERIEPPRGTLDVTTVRNDPTHRPSAAIHPMTNVRTGGDASGAPEPTRVRPVTSQRRWEVFCPHIWGQPLSQRVHGSGMAGGCRSGLAMITVQGALTRWIGMLWENVGTDLHLVAGAPPLIRSGGRLERLTGEPYVSGSEIATALHGYLDAEQWKSLDHDREIDFSLAWEGKARLRGNAFYQRGALSLALRIIPEAIPDFDTLGVPESVRALASLPQGLVLFTGPTGSGKSTSLAALIDWINVNRACHILTIEDPIEYVHHHKKSIVSQREVGSDTLSWERSLRSALREDPDVILLGEMRDPESIAAALTLAETGHLVFSTLHTNDTAQALDRIVDVFPSERQAQIRMQLAGALTGVVAQRLLPTATGGLVAAYEVLLATHAVRNLVREGKTRQIRNVITTSQSEGMMTLEMSLNRLVTQGLVSHEDAVARALHPLEIERPLAGSATR